MRVLMTNRKLVSRWGTELYVRDIAVELLRRGHQPMAFSPEIGPIADEFFDATVPVSDDLDRFGTAPDVIHGQHHLATMVALQRYPGVPVVGVSHGWRPWPEQPVVHPQVRRYVAVDEAVRDRLEMAHGIPGERIEIVPNFVDLDRFTPTASLRPRPERVLLFSNYVTKGSPYLRAAQAAAEALDFRLEVVGERMGTATSEPEKIIGDHDVVLAQGRSALEAMAAGAAVVICSSRMFGPLVTSRNFDELRRRNFGIRTQVLPVSEATLIAQLERYDPADAAAVSATVRSIGGVDLAVERLLAVYAAAIADNAPIDPSDAARASSAFLGGLTAEVYALQEELGTLRPLRTRVDEIDRRLTAAIVRTQQRTRERDHERERAAAAEQRIAGLEAELRSLEASPAFAARRFVRERPVATRGYRVIKRLKP